MILHIAFGVSLVLVSNLVLADEVAYECKANKILARVLKTSDGTFKYLAWNKPKATLNIR